jgi:hypothetical protein
MSSGLDRVAASSDAAKTVLGEASYDTLPKADQGMRWTEFDLIITARSY